MVAQKTDRELDFERKHAEDLQRLRGFRLLDDDFMSKVFEDVACTEFLLQIILNRSDLKVQSVRPQYEIKICRDVLFVWTFWLLMFQVDPITSKFRGMIVAQA